VPLGRAEGNLPESVQQLLGERKLQSGSCLTGTALWLVWGAPAQAQRSVPAKQQRTIE
jgi:hypothetical protein